MITMKFGDNQHNIGLFILVTNNWKVNKFERIHLLTTDYIVI